MSTVSFTLFHEGLFREMNPFKIRNILVTCGEHLSFCVRMFEQMMILISQIKPGINQLGQQSLVPHQYRRESLLVHNALTQGRRIPLIWV